MGEELYNTTSVANLTISGTPVSNSVGGTVGGITDTIDIGDWEYYIDPGRYIFKSEFEQTLRGKFEKLYTLISEHAHWDVSKEDFMRLLDL